VTSGKKFVRLRLDESTLDELHAVLQSLTEVTTAQLLDDVYEAYTRVMTIASAVDSDEVFECGVCETIAVDIGQQTC